MKQYLHIFILVCLFLASEQAAFAQVTIGSSELPLKGALLDLKQWEATTENSVTANKGLLLPRVSLKAANQLTPLYGGVDNGDGTWTDESTPAEKQLSIGAVVYNVNEDAIDIYSKGIYIWTGVQWIGLVDNSGTYSINCDKTEVDGHYKKNEALGDSNTITVEVEATAGGSYQIYTEKVNGIYFEAKGILVEGKQTITLKGAGTLTTHYPFDMEINIKSKESTAVCNVTIPVTYPDMTYAIIGSSSSYYSWGGDPRKSLLAASTQPDGSFSPTGIVRVGQFSLWQNIMTTANAAKTALGWSYFNTYGELDPNIVYPDLILYYSYLADADVQLAQLLSAYVNAGGGILFGSSDYKYAPVNIMMQEIFGLPNNVAQEQAAGPDDDVYPIANLPNDPIINGPFGNLTDKYWGEDNATKGSVVLTMLPPNSVQICTARSERKNTVPLSNSIVWYNEQKNFVYIGDSTGASLTDTTSGAFPTKYNRSGNAYYPGSKIYGPPSYTKSVYNAALELNALAWLMQQAAKSGINPH